MKIKFLIAALFFSLVAAAQPSNYIKFNTRGRWIAGMFDSTLHVPRFNGSPSLRTGGSSMDGAIAIDTANGVFYFYYNGAWKRANIDTSAYAVTSVYRKTASDSVFYVKGGVHTFAFKDSTGGSTPTLQQVLTAGSTLTGGNTIDADGNEFYITNVGDLGITATNGLGAESTIYSNGVTIQLFPNAGLFYIDTINYTLSTTGKKILIRDTATGLVQNIDPSLLGASSYTFTNGITESGGTVKLGGTLTEGTTTLDGGTTNTLRFQDMLFEVTSSNTIMLGDSISLTGGATPNRLSDIKLKNDTIKINPGIGLLYIDTLTSAVGTKALRYNPTTGLVTYADTTSGGADGYVDNATFNTTTNYLTIEQTGAADVSVRIPPSYIINPINADSLTRIVNDSTLMVKAVVIADTDPVEVTTVRNDSLNTHTIAIRQTFLDSIRNGDFGGGSPGGSTKQIQYNNAGAFGGAAGFEYQSGSSPNVTITGQNAAHVPLYVKGIGSTQTADLFRVMRYDDSAMFRIAANGSVTLGPPYDYVNAHHAPGHEFKYSNGGYTGGIKLRNLSSGSIVRLHTVNNGLYITDDAGSATPMTLGTRTNPADASTFVAASGVWTISAGRLGINGTAHASAQLDAASTTRGFLMPRMTGTQAEAISSPAEGLLVYATDGSGATITTKGWWGYDGSTWVKLN